MNIHEHQAKEILKEFGAPVSKGIVIFSLNELDEKFKELKSLVVSYNKDKDKEINDLKEDLNKFKIMVDKNKEVYEKMLDNATESIETFIQNSSEDNILQ